MTNAMTPHESNALIAKAMSADSEEEWRAWAHDRCNCKWNLPDSCPANCEGRVPRDFADPKIYLTLLRWVGECTDLLIDPDEGDWVDALALLVLGSRTEADVATMLRDTIATRLKEIADAN